MKILNVPLKCPAGYDVPTLVYLLLYFDFQNRFLPCIYLFCKNIDLNFRKVNWAYSWRITFTFIWVYLLSLWLKKFVKHWRRNN
jgi:hypothetical protein